MICPIEKQYHTFFVYMIRVFIVIARLSKNLKNGDFSNFAWNKINNLQVANLQI